MQSGYHNEFYQQNEDEYEEDGYEEYDGDGLESAEEDEPKEREERKPSKEELDFLMLREKLKEKFRQKLKKQSAKIFGHSVLSQDSRRTTTKDNFGSFFGPSQPVIASRVLDESRSIRETKHIISKPPTSSGHERVSAASSSERKPYEHHEQSNHNELKRKAQALKSLRDYSSLLSDDADSPDTKEPQPASRHVLGPKPNAQSTQVPPKSKMPIKSQYNSAPNGREMKASILTNRQTPTNATVMRKPPSSSEPRKVPGVSSGGKSHSRPVGSTPLPKPMPSKVLTQSRAHPQAPATGKLNSKPTNSLSSQKSNLMAKPHSSTQNHHLEAKRANQAADRNRVAQKPALLPQKSQPPKLNPTRISRDEPVKKLVRRRPDDDDDDPEGAIQAIRKMFRYNPSKYAGMDDDDDSDMEAGFAQIQMEERRSAQIAREEDEEQLRLIEEEERRERMRKKHKSSKW